MEVWVCVTIGSTRNNKAQSYTTCHHRGLLCFEANDWLCYWYWRHQHACLTWYCTGNWALHQWTSRVQAGLFHHFSTSWVVDGNEIECVTAWFLKHVKICEENQEWNTQLTEVMKAQAFRFLQFDRLWHSLTMFDIVWLLGFSEALDFSDWGTVVFISPIQPLQDCHGSQPLSASGASLMSTLQVLVGSSMISLHLCPDCEKARSRFQQLN